MNELPTIEKFIYQVLANDSVLNSYVSSRIYSYQLPRNAVFPLIQYSYLAGRDVQGMGVSRTLSRPLYQIKVIGRETLPNVLQAIADRIDAIFQTIAALNFENLAISARREQPVSYQESGGESETSFRHLGGFFRFDVSGTDGANSPIVYPATITTDTGFRIFEFQFNNVASQVIYTFQQSGFIVGLEAEITAVFNGAGAGLSIGTASSPELLLTPSEIDVSQLMTGGKSSNLAFSAGDEIRLFLTPGSGATQGAGRIILEVI